jgi:hypothetical protein
MERENFVRFIFNGSWNSVVHRENIDNKLLEYEQTVSIAAQEGIDLKTKECIYQWSYIQSVFFASTILTTIGNVFCRIITCNKANFLNTVFCRSFKHLVFFTGPDIFTALS